MSVELIEFLSEGNILRGTMSRSERPKSTVVCLTGDGKSGSQSATWPSLISALNKVQLDVCIFDFVGQGLSSGERTSLTLNTAVRNLEDFSLYCTKNNLVRTEDVSCVASSFGATVLLNSKFTSNLSRICFKSPAFVLYEAYENELGGIDGIKLWRESGVHPESGLSFDAYESALSSRCYRNLLCVESQILIIVGDKDEVVSAESCFRAASIRPDAISVEIIRGAKHDYKQDGARERFEQLSSDFLGA
jgi:hypothetical protein